MQDGSLVVVESFVPDFIRFVTFENTFFRDGFLNQSYVELKGALDK